MGKLLLFDYDGVLVESLNYYYEKVKGALNYMGLDLIKTVEDYLTLFEDNFYASLVKRGVDLAQFMVAIKAVAEPRNSKHVHPFMIPIVRSLAQRYPLIVISSNSQESIAPLLHEAEILECFQAIMGAETAFSKEEKINLARAKAEARGEDTYYIGDTAGDIKEGKAVRVKTIAVTWGWHKKDRLAEAGADFLVEHPEELLEILQK